MKKFLRIFLLVLVIICIAAGAGYWYIHHKIYQPLNDDETLRYFTIEEGNGVKEIGNALEEEKFIHNSWYFEVYVWLKGIESKFKAGHFQIASAMNIPKIAEVLIGEPISREMEITIIEGWDRRDIDLYLTRKEELETMQEGAFIEATRDLQTNVIGGKYGLPQEISWEGFLFPDTYRIYKDASVEDILSKMIINFQKKVDPLLAQIESQGKTLFEILIMASIVEKESANREEMPMVASVFYNRLNNDLLLESDATVNFVTGKKLRQPTLEDTEVDSPYNTYINKGLPPGPICNPGLAAIKAALEPAESDYFFFIHPEGQKAIFSETLDEHIRMRRLYLDNEE